MKFTIKHEKKGRIRVHLFQKYMNFTQADTLQYYLENLDGVKKAQVFNRTSDALIYYTGERNELLKAIQAFGYSRVSVPAQVLENSGRELNETYKEKLVNKVIFHYGRKLLLPYPLSAIYTTAMSVKYIWLGVKTLWKRKIEVPVLDATAIGVSIFRGDFSTAGSVMFLLGIGELLEEWTHKKSVDDLARTMSLNTGKVWLRSEGTEVLVDADKIQAGDMVVVHIRNVIPFDGLIAEGEAMVNQASLTGESVPVRKVEGNSVYAGTVVEEGEAIITVKAVGGSSRYEKIAAMIEDTEKLKSGLESKAEHLADRLVPYTLGGTALTYLLTRNVTKAVSVLMVDFSCALKLAMPVSVLSAIREAGEYKITVKGGKFLEAVADADTIVFDKTGTLTKAEPTVAEIVPFNGQSEDELLRIAACLEEHFPHSMAKAVVDAAKKRKLDHEEMHSKVEYIVAHGISTTIEGKKAIIGSSHFVFEDEKCTIPEGMEERFKNLPNEYSHHNYLAESGFLQCFYNCRSFLTERILNTDNSCKTAFNCKVVMMTGDSERTARAVAARVGVDEYYSEVLPEDKASFVEKEKAKGRKVVMLGDGINDSPALSAADAGIAVSEGAEIAREIADITIGADNLEGIVILKHISDALMKRIHNNYRTIVGFNTGLILLGVAGILQPTTSALLHNTSTLLIGMNSMKNLVSTEEI